MPKQFLTTDEAAARLGISPGSMRNMRVRGHGPCFAKLGRMVRYDIDRLDAWARGQTYSSTSEKASA